MRPYAETHATSGHLSRARVDLLQLEASRSAFPSKPTAQHVCCCIELASSSANRPRSDPRGAVEVMMAFLQWAPLRRAHDIPPGEAVGPDPRRSEGRAGCLVTGKRSQTWR